MDSVLRNIVSFQPWLLSSSCQLVSSGLGGLLIVVTFIGWYQSLESGFMRLGHSSCFSAYSCTCHLPIRSTQLRCSLRMTCVDQLLRPARSSSLIRYMSTWVLGVASRSWEVLWLGVCLECGLCTSMVLGSELAASLRCSERTTHTIRIGRSKVTVAVAVLQKIA
jgi:hypothetical protein